MNNMIKLISWAYRNDLDDSVLQQHHRILDK